MWRLLKQTFSEWSADKAPEMGAALAFYTALSIAPLLVIVLGIAGMAMGKDVHGEVETQMKSMVGDEGAKALSDMVASANKPTEGIIATALSVITLLFGASGVFGQLQSSLNTIWEVEPKPGRGIWGMIRDRFLSFTMVLGIAFLLLVSLLLTATLSTLTKMVHAPESMEWLGHALNFGASFVVITLLFAMMYRVLPDVKISWRDVWLGAIITALLFTIGKFAIGLYIGHSAMASSYGVVGSFVVLLVWVYYSAQILFFGAELTKAYADAYGSKIVPTENAVPLTAEARAEQGRPRRAPVPR